MSLGHKIETSETENLQTLITYQGKKTATYSLFTHSKPLQGFVSFVLWFEIDWVPNKTACKGMHVS